MEITSLQNNKVKYWVSLKQKKQRDLDRVFLIEGNHLVDEALSLGIVKETISTKNKNADYFVTKEIMQKISSQKSISDIAAVCAFLPEAEIKGNILVLDGLQDPGNLGTLIRSSVAFNFETIILSDDSVDLYNDKVIRASEGMIFKSNILRRNLHQILPEIKGKGYKIIGTDVVKGKTFKEILPEKKIAIVIGNEGNGMSDSVRNLCDEFTKIPMMSNCESLNAAIAGSILMYEAYYE